MCFLSLFILLINNLGGYSFGETADGKPGYRKPGADTVIPFSNGFIVTLLYGYQGTTRWSSSIKVSNKTKLTISVVSDSNGTLVGTLKNGNTSTISNSIQAKTYNISDYTDLTIAGNASANMHFGRATFTIS